MQYVQVVDTSSARECPKWVQEIELELALLESLASNHLVNTIFQWKYHFPNNLDLVFFLAHVIKGKTNLDICRLTTSPKERKVPNLAFVQWHCALKS